MTVSVEKTDLSLKYTDHYNRVKELLAGGSPDVLNEKRAIAFRDFVNQGIPTRKNEDYKYTNLNPFFLPEYVFLHRKPAETEEKTDIFNCGIPQLDKHLTFVNNGWYNRKNSVQAPDGVVLDSLENAAAMNHPAFRKYYASIAETATDATVALNTAFAKDGFFLFIPKGTRVEKPLQIVNLLKHNADTFVTQRNLIIIEDGADARVILCNHTLNRNRYLSNSVTEIIIGENASFHYYSLQNQHNDSACIHSVFVHQQRNSNFNTNTISLHGGLIRNNMHVNLDGENAEANLYGIAFIDRKQHVDNFIRITHSKPHCQSNQLFKNILDDEASGAFSGRIHVMRDAQKTNAFQRNNNLLLTDKATMQTKPQLIIDADDVKCSHGATVGQIDEEALFYLRARGINEDRARLMMMNAFAHEVVQQISSEPLRERIDELVDKRLRGEVARCHDCDYQCEC